jgi:hypothetical protein
VAGLIVSFCVVALANTALAAPKKKKSEPAPAPAAAEPAEDKNVDDLMKESSTKKSTSVSSDSADTGSSKESEEPVGEPDAWERPPMEEEKPKAAPPPKVEEKYGDGRRIEVGLTPGFGFKQGKADWATLDPYGLGLGIRGGYELDMKIFIGAGFVYHLGESDDRPVNTPGAPTAGFVTVRQNYMLAFVEGGYDLWFGDVILRPSIWLGMGFAIVDPYLTTGGVRTVSDFMFAPGASLIYTLDGWYIGADFRYVAVTADGAKAIDLFAMIGLRFK